MSGHIAPMRDGHVPGKRCCHRETLVPSPTIESFQRRYGAIPRRTGNPARAGYQAAGTVIGDDILTIGLPHALAPAAFGEKANPGKEVAGICPDAVGGPDTDARALSKEPIELEIVATIVADDERCAVNEFGTVSRVSDR